MASRAELHFPELAILIFVSYGRPFGCRTKRLAVSLRRWSGAAQRDGDEKMTSRGVKTQAVYDELRRIEGEVAQGEVQLAEKEAHLVALQRENADTGKVGEELELMRTQQRERGEHRHGLLALLQL